MRIALLGPLEVRDDEGTLLDVPGLRLRTLLARLAVDAGRPVSPDSLIEAVWAHEPPAGPTNALQSLMARLRRRLPPTSSVDSQVSGYRLVVPAGGLDIVEFERLVALGGADRTAPLEQALRLWRGEPFADLESPAFATATTARLAELRLRAVEQLVEGELESGDATDRIALLTELVVAQPLREGLRELHMRALLAAGRPAQALASFEELRRILADELGSDPSAALRELHTSILRADTGANPAQRAASRTAHRRLGYAPGGGNLGAALTSFVGRTAELARLRTLLRDTRLVTLVGPGGAGKTRLATEVARSADYRDGAWLVELAGVRDPVEVAGAVLTALGIADTGLLHAGPRDPVQRLVDALRDRETLLLLDNCEHQLDACARLAEAVLGGCPGVRVLVTTREPLAITGEVLCPLGPLAVPPPSVDLVAATRVASILLFVDRARAVRPGFELTAANLAGVAEICRRLDGLPLAIELACARLRTAGVDEIAGRLGDRFRLLTGGSRTALPRHQTLAAVVEWSWGSFSEPERRLARRLAVFAGGATARSAEAVCAGDDLAAPDVLNVLGALVDKSFVQLLDVPDGPPRYRMLDTIRAYASAALAQAGESESVRRAHARYFLAMAETAEPELRRHDQLRWLAWFREEYDNLTTALRWAVDADDAETAVRLAVATGWYWVLCGSTAEATAWLREVLAMPGLDELPDTTLAVAYAYDAIYHFSVQDLDRAVRSATAAREAVGDALHPAVAVVTAIIQINQVDLAAALAGLARLVDHPDRWTASVGELMRGHAAESSGDALGAIHHFAASREMFAAVGDRWGIMMALSALGNIESLAGDSTAALATMAEAERRAEEVGAQDDLEWTRARQALERFRAGDVEGARAELERIRSLGLARGRATLVVISESWLADLIRHDGDLDRARDLLTISLGRLAGASGALIPRLRIMCEIGLARVSAAAGELSAADEYAEQALTQALSIGDRSMVAAVAEGIADVALARGEFTAAARHLGLAAATRGIADHGSLDALAVQRAATEALGATAYRDLYEQAASLPPHAAVAALTNR